MLLLVRSSGSPTVEGKKEMEGERELVCGVVAKSPYLEMDRIGWSKLKCKVRCCADEKMVKG